MACVLGDRVYLGRSCIGRLEASVTALTPAAPAAVGKRVDTCGFYPVCFATYSQFTDTYCYTYGLLCAECDITVPCNSLACYDR